VGQPVHRQAFVAVPLLRAIVDRTTSVEIDGRRLELTGLVGTGPIIAGFAAHRAHVSGDGMSGWIDLSAASSWRCEMTLRLDGAHRDDVERLLLAFRAALVEAAQRGAPPRQSARMDVCRTA